MDKFFQNLGGGDKKKPSNNKQKDGSWKGGASDMDALKKKNNTASSRLASVGSGGGGKKPAGAGGSNNIFANAAKELGKIGLNTKQSNTRGGGKSLGGSKPGIVISVSLDQPGSLGMEVEKRRNTEATAIIARIVPNSQAEKAGLKRGDIVCHPNSNGESDIRYDQFLAMAKSGRRPLQFDVRRIESSVLSGGGTTGSNSKGGRVSADSYARKQAVIAAAEARDAKHKAKQKPIPKLTEKKMDGLRPEQKIYDHTHTNNSEETRRAVAAIKKAEQNDAQIYQAKNMTSAQARTATVAVTAGDINAENAPSKMTEAAPGRVNKPTDPTSKIQPLGSEFEHAFSTLVTSNSDHTAVLKSLSIMRKLINNAVTKGQQGDDETSSKFRRVRLSNPRIKEAIADLLGALDLMMSVGFVISENDEDGETYLVFPPGERGPSWLDNALSTMESYENGGQQ